MRHCRSLHPADALLGASGMSMILFLIKVIYKINSHKTVSSKEQCNNGFLEGDTTTVPHLILSQSIIFQSIISKSIISHSIVSRSIIFHSIIFHLIIFHSIIFHLIVSHLIIFRSIAFYLIIFHLMPYCDIISYFD
jgi:hypothetical protein